MSYRAGDHIAVLPRNAAELVGRAAALAELDLDELVVIHPNTGARSHLPLDIPFVVSELLAARVELQAPLTRAQIRTLAEFATDPGEQAEIAGLAADGEQNIARYREQILFKESFAVGHGSALPVHRCTAQHLPGPVAGTGAPLLLDFLFAGG